MAIAFVQKGHNYGTTQNRTISFGSNVATGSLIFVLVGRYSGSPVTGITGGTGNTFARIGTETQYAGDSSLCADLWYAFNVNGGFTQLTVAAAAAQNSTIWIAEFSGIATTSPLDQAVVANTSTAATTFNSGNTGTTAQADELVIGATVPNIGDASHTISAGSGFSNAEIESNGNDYIAGAIESKIVSSTGAYNATFTVNSAVGYICRCVTFKAGTAVPASLALLNGMRRNQHLLMR